jgi:hypothetical protein
MAKEKGKTVNSEEDNSEFNVAEMIAFFEKALKKLDPEKNMEQITQIHFTINQLKTGN